MNQYIEIPLIMALVSIVSAGIFRIIPVRDKTKKHFNKAVFIEMITECIASLFSALIIWGFKIYNSKALLMWIIFLMIPAAVIMIPAVIRDSVEAKNPEEKSDDSLIH